MSIPPLPNPAWERVVQAITPQGHLRRIWPLTGGISAQMTALEIALPHGRIQKMILRSYAAGQANQIAAEFKLLQMTHAWGLATPAPYYLDLSGQIFPHPYLVMAYIEGEMLFAPVNLDEHLRQLAAHLAQIHTIDGTAPTLAFLPPYPALCPELARERPLPANTFLETTTIYAAMTARRPLTPNPPTLLHGDFWPGNTLWRDGRLVAIIDWEDAQRGDPLTDLAKSRSEIVWIFGIEAMHTFTHAYLSLSPLDTTDLPYWDLCAALRLLRFLQGNLADAATYFHSFGRDDIHEQTIGHDLGYFGQQAVALWLAA